MSRWIAIALCVFALGCDSPPQGDTNDSGGGGEDTDTETDPPDDTGDPTDTGEASDTADTGGITDTGDVADTSDTAVALIDADGDGFDDSVDCDDADDQVFPGATEVCNGIDDDCTGGPDDGLAFTDWYSDVDTDGYGDPATGMSACAQPAGTVADSTDCDDGDIDVNPGATEVCNGVDDDCAGGPDDGLAFADWYADSDLDGFGDIATAVSACAQPAGTVADGTDCDDTDDTIRPDADELCDAVDRDCDGDALAGATDTTIYFQDADSDGWGNVVSTTDACTQPAGYVAVSGDCDDTAGAVNPAALEVCDPSDVDEDCSGDADDADSGVTDPVTWYLDTDGDGYGDPSNTVIACDAPANGLLDASDCDDSTDAISPADAEICGNGVDEDCSGVADSGCPVNHCGGPNTVSADEFWSASQVHLIDCDLYVEGAGNPLLTIEPGARVEFVNRGSLLVGFNAAGGLDAQGVLFTSGEALPAPDDWKGLLLNQFTDTARTTLDGSTVELAGWSNARVVHAGITLWQTDVVVDGVTVQDTHGMGIRSRHGDPGVINSIVRNNSDNGVMYTEGAPSEFTGNQIDNNTGHAVVIDNDAATDISGGNTAAGNTHDTIWLRGNNLNVDTTWPDAGIPYLVQDDLVVNGASGATLTIEDGVVVEFQVFRGLFIGSTFGTDTGALWIDAPSTGVRFTSHAASPLAGDWDGLHTRGGMDASATRIRGLTVEFAGNSAFAGINDSSGELVIDGCEVRDGADEGILLGDGAVEVRGCYIHDNAGPGIITANSAVVDISGNVIEDNGGPSIRTYPSAMPGIGANTISGNADDRIELVAGTTTRSGLWANPGVPYRVVGAARLGPNTVVELGDGLVMEFEPGTELYVNGTSSNPSGLVVSAPATPPVLTSAQPPWLRVPGSWNGLKIEVYGSLTDIDGLVVEYGGQDNEGNIFVDTPARLRNVDSQFSSNHGLMVGPNEQPDIADSVFATNVGDGVHFQPNAYPGPPMNNVQMTDNSGAPLVICSTGLEHLGSGLVTTGNGNPMIIVEPCTSTTTLVDTTLADHGVPYFIVQQIYVGGDVYIEPGVTFIHGTGVGWIVGQIIPGALHTTGSGDPVVFTSGQSLPGPGDWTGLWIRNGATAHNMTLDNVHILYAGSSFGGAVDNEAQNVSITNSRIEHSASWGVWADPWQVDISGTTFNFNTSGDHNW